EMLTGVVTGPGLGPTPGEHLTDTSGRWVGHDVLPVEVDRAEPSRFVVLWDEVAKPDFRAQAREQAQQAAARMQDGGPATAPRPAPQVYVYDDSSGSAAPDWAREMIDELRGSGVAGVGEALSGQPGTAGGPPLVIDLTAGHLSAADAASLASSGEQATAVLTGISDVAVPQAALPGPTASLCDLTLQVRRADGRSYTTSTRLGFRNAQRRAAVAVIGAVLPVRVDPRDETRVAVDVAAFDAEPPA
ncbi:MAG TPA: hypothetical protein VGD68_03810, partial [Streptosporangiaceae bacterium]